MKKIAFLLFVLVLPLLSMLSCGTKVERFELKEVDFLTITVDHYEYNYIELNHTDGTYKLENKVKQNGIVSKQTGKFLIDKNNNIIFTNDAVPEQDYLLYSGEKCYLKDNKIYVDANILGYGDIHMIFEK